MNTKLFYCLIITFFFLGCITGENAESPEVTTKEIIEVYTDYVVASGEITNLEGYKILDHGFVWARQSAPTIEDHKLALGQTDKPGTFQGRIEELEYNTFYYIRSFVEYEGNNIVYGNEQAFETLDVNNWIEKSGLIGGPLAGAVSFFVNDRLYVGTGWSFSYSNEFYAYSYRLDTWEKISSLPADKRIDAISFSVDNYGYVGLGYSCTSSTDCNYHKDIWRYDPQNDSWTKITDYPGTAKLHSTSFVVGDKAYITGGYSWDFKLWEYDPTTDTWTEKSAYPGECYSRGLAFSINDKGYMGLGWSDGTCNDLWEYDPDTDSWTEKADLPGKPRYDAIGFSFKGKGFVVCGVKQDSGPREYLTDMWRYEPVSDSWTKIDTNYPGKGRVEMIVGIVTDKIIIGLGANNILHHPDDRFDDIWEYIPEEGY